MIPIGGYFELELNNFGSVYHDKAIAVNSGRNALEYILLVNNYKKIYIPYYTCDVILHPIKKLNLPYEFYYLDKNFNPKVKKVNTEEALLFVNYFGLFDERIISLIKTYSNLIIDNAQAFYSFPYYKTQTIYSPRKFFGLPDGGFVYPMAILNKELSKDKSINKTSHLLERIENGAERGYILFQENDKKLDNLPLKKMSDITYSLLLNIKFEEIKNTRNYNFELLHNALKQKNELTTMIEKTAINGPMVYPFLKKGNKTIRNKLMKNKIYIAQYWPNIKEWVKDENIFENYLYHNLLPLPIDQRYGKTEMKHITNIINNLL